MLERNMRLVMRHFGWWCHCNGTELLRKANMLHVEKIVHADCFLPKSMDMYEPKIIRSLISLARVML